jgi:hypothetical protein
MTEKELGPRIQISKRDFLRFLEDKMGKSEVSWMTTDVRSFEWGEINLNESKFINQLRSLKFNKAFVGVFNPITKRMEYFAFILSEPREARE